MPSARMQVQGLILTNGELAATTTDASDKRIVVKSVFVARKSRAIR